MKESNQISKEEKKEVEEEIHSADTVEQGEAVKQDAQNLWESLVTFIKGTFNFRDDTDRVSTIRLIQADIPFKGATAWILIFSIFIASVGLNANSIPVVIGAMLISPLMGPILGIGLSIAIHDIETLRKSLINFAVMVVLSVLTAYLFFKLFPLKVESSELLARTRPDIRDVLIAFFGGLALVIARCKTGTIASVIFGVAIATALMPPLCTVGFGLAIGKPLYALGAMYLFMINTIFIALATFIVVKLLKFPMQRYANSRRRKLISRTASFVAILAMIPAIRTFIVTLEENKALGDYDRFMLTEIEGNEDLYLRKPIYDFENKSIKLFFDGEVTDATVTDLQNEIRNYPALEGFKLYVRGNRARGMAQVSKAYDRAIDELNRLENTNDGLNLKIKELESQLQKVQSNVLVVEDSTKQKMISFDKLSLEAKRKFPNLERLMIVNTLSTDFTKIDTIQSIKPVWRFKVGDSLNKIRKEQVRTWIAEQLGLKELVVEN